MRNEPQSRFRNKTDHSALNSSHYCWRSIYFVLITFDMNLIFNSFVYSFYFSLISMANVLLRHFCTKLRAMNEYFAKVMMIWSKQQSI